MKFAKFIHLAWLILVFSVKVAQAQVNPCYGNPQFTGGVCIGDTFTVFSSGALCNTCVYQWSQSSATTTLVAGGSPSDSFAAYTFTPPAFGIGYQTLDAYYTDTAGTYCTGGSTWDHWDLSVFGLAQLTDPLLLNGPYTGDTSQTWIYVRFSAGFYPNYDYSTRSYSVQGGTLVNAVYGAPWGPSGPYEDTLYIQWNNTASRQINCGALYLAGSQNLGNPWPQSCGPYVETIPPEPLHPAWPVGMDTVCLGDTVTYYTTPVAGATYAWTVTGGTMLSGQGTDEIQVVWNTLPGSVAISRDVGGSISSNSLPVQVNTGNVALQFPSRTTYCVGSPLTLDAGPASSWLWSNGATTQTITVNDSGNYAVTVTIPVCGSPQAFSDSIRVNRAQPLQPDLGPDRWFCTDTAQAWSFTTGYDSVFWNGSSAHQPGFSTTSGGTFWVQVRDSNGCAAVDSVDLLAVSPPFVNLGPNQGLCAGDSLLLNAGNPGATYLWSTGASSQTLYAQAGSTTWVTVSDSGCVQSDTVVLGSSPLPAINLGTDSTYCASDSLLLDAGNPGATYLWSNGATSQTVWFSAPGPVSVTVTANGCSNAAALNLVELSDCVWPGDCDNDGTANNNDVLALGTVFGATGPVRTGANLNWVGQEALDWTGNVLPGVNRKHCDSDGNGTANADDTLAIVQNFGLTHNKTGSTGSTGIPLRLVALSDSLFAGDTAYFDLELGTALSLADSVYGLAYTLHYDANLVDAQGLLSADYGNAWFCPPAEQLSLTYDLPSQGRAECALVRTNQSDTAGFGPVARFGFVLRQTLPSSSEVFMVSLSNARVVDHALMNQEIVVESDSVTVLEPGVGVRPVLDELMLSVRPNPADDRVWLGLSRGHIQEVRLFNLQGAQVLEQWASGASEVKLQLEGLSEGIYLLWVKDDQGRRWQQKLSVQR